MAKRELSSTLKNLKFMQRATQKEEKGKVLEQVKPVADFGASPAPARRCIVIMEGDPHPGALKGRMSFQSFNPSIDKLNEEAADNHQKIPHTSNNSANSNRVDGASATVSSDSKISGSNNASDLDLKRKQPAEVTDKTTPQKLLKIFKDGGEQSSCSNSSRTVFKRQQKCEKLDWNVLRPPKSDKRG
ncbi:hypothetical protein Cni_G10701 [Canna indica]|uniref:M-phase phosphoprotein 6 n=1 Tax=Canna indica TaxID=4628 RepID=A0AAQ3K868_9LILI|nr:hypothetical protein Cni_G10701 [Canna indica]